jgi:hypothetical protein
MFKKGEAGMFKRSVFITALLMSCALGALAGSPAAPGRSSGVLRAPVVVRPLKFDISPALRDMKPVPAPKGVNVPTLRVMPDWPLPKAQVRNPEKLKSESDPAVQSWPGTKAMPAPLKSWEGISNSANAPYAVLPPDTEGDVGVNDYVQWVNLSLAIWDKNGNLLYGPVAGNTIWQGFGGPADSCNDGDPVVLYDRIANRWFISQFALCDNSGTGPYYQYIAVSVTSDPTGAWYRYAFEWPNNNMPDYPKFGVWPDGYYMSCNQFTTSGSWAGAGVAVFDRDKMLAGDPTASFQYFNLYTVNPSYGGMLPSTFQGSTIPPAGEPNYFVEMDDDAWGYPNDQLSIWAFHVDWADPDNTTFGSSGNPETVLQTESFDTNFCGGTDCITQPDTTATLDPLSDRLMYRLQYRNFGGYQTLVVNHTVDVGNDQAGIRWYELRNWGNGWGLFQQSTFAPDTDNRWMGSAAMDKNGDIAIGYSVSSDSTYPSVRYAGRLATDPPDELTQGESTMINGGGSQLSPHGRWGDYSTMTVDPVDDCTFWYTQEYYATSSTSGWQTRIGAFRFPSCGETGGDLTVTAQATPNSGYLPLAVSFSAVANNGTGPYSYAWDFGDGTTGAGATVSHTYENAGNYTATATVTDSVSASASATVTVQVKVVPPVITKIKKMHYPFRLKIRGSNFHSDCTVMVNNVAVPQTTFKNSTKVVAKKGHDLKDLVPKGQTVQITVVNNDDGGVSAPFSFTK